MKQLGEMVDFFRIVLSVFVPQYHPMSCLVFHDSVCSVVSLW